MSLVMDTTKKGSNKRRDFIRLQQQQKRRKPAPLSETHKRCKQQSEQPKHQREREKKIARETRRLGQVKNIFSLLTQVTYRFLTTYLLNKSMGNKLLNACNNCPCPLKLSKILITPPSPPQTTFSLFVEVDF
jgi:hypothetical protein